MRVVTSSAQFSKADIKHVSSQQVLNMKGSPVVLNCAQPIGKGRKNECEKLRVWTQKKHTCEATAKELS